MIKSNELRIGNWILNGNNHPIIVGYHEIRYATINPLTLNNYEPIPLTPEILEKAGFVVGGDDNEGVELLIPDGSIFIEDETGETYFSSGYSYSRISNIENVHQLQNLYFALTGEELEIKL